MEGRVVRERESIDSCRIHGGLNTVSLRRDDRGHVALPAGLPNSVLARGICPSRVAEL